MVLDRPLDPSEIMVNLRSACENVEMTLSSFRRFVPLLIFTAYLSGLAPRSIADDSASGFSGSSEDSVQWGPLLRQSAVFLGIEHGFRFATEAGTRDGLNDGGFFSGYASSVANLHGWADGDPFIVNYVGHPMQGSVSGDIWIQNDPRYRTAEFGRNRRYWISSLRAAAFAWAYSEQFEIGPISEASLGHVQHYFPQQGYVDHVITPVVGFGWMVAEDFLDRHIVKRIEARTRNRWIRMIARGGFNPSRSFANCIAFREPWHRDTRPGILTYDASLDPSLHVHEREPREPNLGPWKTSKFEFATAFNQTVLGDGGHDINCSGGGANAVYNVNSVFGIEGEVSGCKMLGLETNLSGDANYFLFGPRFSYRSGDRWKSYVHVLVGGEKLTQERLDTAERALVEATMPAALQIGGGVELALNRNFAIRLGDLEINHAWLSDLNGESYPDSFRLTTGVVLRVGSDR